MIPGPDNGPILASWLDEGLPEPSTQVVLFLLMILSLLGRMAGSEPSGLSRNLIGPIFLFSKVMI